MNDEFKIINSPLGQRITRDGTTIDVQIYRGEHEPAWILEVVDSAGGSTVWEDTFQTEQDALNEVFQTIASEGIGCFLLDPEASLNVRCSRTAFLLSPRRSSNRSPFSRPALHETSRNRSHSRESSVRPDSCR